MHVCGLYLGAVLNASMLGVVCVLPCIFLIFVRVLNLNNGSVMD